MAKRKARPVRPGRHTLTEQLKGVIADRGVTCYALAADAGVNAAVVSRFLAGERDIRLGTADKLAAALGLRLAEAPGRPGRPRGRATGAGDG